MVNENVVINVDNIQNAVKGDAYMVNVINKIIAKVEAGRGIVEEFTPAELKQGAFDRVVVPISSQEDIDTYREILDVMNIPVYEMLEDGEEYEVELANYKDRRPTMLIVDEHDVVHYDSFFHSEPCEIGGNAYRISFTEEDSFFLIKVHYDNKYSYELYLSTNTEVDTDEYEEYVFYNETRPLCNSEADGLADLFDKLFDASHDRVHKPVISDSLKAKLERLLE